jgi:hypothetical protein
VEKSAELGNEPRRPVTFKTLPQPISRYTFAPVELCQTTLDLGVDGLFVLPQPSLAFALYF